jgi:hypothetical protein
VADLYKHELNKYIINIYYNIFKGFSFEQFEKAICEVIKSNKYNVFPKPANILEFLEGTRDDKALIAWLQVKEAIEKGGYYASIEFADPVISNCIKEIGGWMELCSQQKDEMPFIEKRFMDLYRLFLKRGVEKPVKLIGFVEAKNNERGFLRHMPKPLKIGFEEQKVLIKKD